MTARLRSLLLAVLVAVAACDTPGPSVAPTATPVPLPTPVHSTYELNVDVWYEGLILHVARATTALSSAGGTVDVFMTVENPGAEPSDLDAVIRLAVAGTRIDQTRDSQVPTTPAGENRLALLRFELQEIESVADGVLEIGAAPDHVAKVPFTAAAGEPVTFEPIAISPRGTGAAGDLRITLRSGVVRWDLPDWSQELPATLRVVTITYDATYTGSFVGGIPFTGENIALRLPNGDVVEARRDGHSQSIETIGAGKTKKNLMSRFEIPADATGDFAIIVRMGSASRAIKFTIAG